MSPPADTSPCVSWYVTLTLEWSLPGTSILNVPRSPAVSGEDHNKGGLRVIVAIGQSEFSEALPKKFGDVFLRSHKDTRSITAHHDHTEKPTHRRLGPEEGRRIRIDGLTPCPLSRFSESFEIHFRLNFLRFN